MIATKKYACHRVYDAPGHCFTQSVVSLSADGEVVSCTPLTEEVSSTEWIGGVIVLSSLTEIPPHADYRTWLLELTPHASSPLYAWHITGFDFERGIPTIQSVIRRL